MKLCIPTLGNGGLDDVVSEHFGRAPTQVVFIAAFSTLTTLLFFRKSVDQQEFGDWITNKSQKR